MPNGDALEDDVVIVTGSGRNIGKAIAKRFAAEGGRVVIADLAEDRANEVAERIERDGGQAHPVVADVATEKGAARIVTETEHTFGSVDVLVNNAAVKERVPLLNMNVETFDRTIAVNLRGAFLCTQAAARSMRNAGGGRIVNVSSTSGLTGRADGAAYATSKAALLNLTRSAAVALADDGIRVNALIPTRTGVRTLSPAAAGDEEAVESDPFEENDTLVDRVGEPADQAAAALHLVAPESDFVTGTALRVDGGRCA